MQRPISIQKIIFDQKAKNCWTIFLKVKILQVKKQEKMIKKLKQLLRAKASESKMLSDKVLKLEMEESEEEEEETEDGEYVEEET